MKALVISISLLLATLASAAPQRIALRANDFHEGGWKLDTQFLDVIGSPHLLAHGLGHPVADAQATITLPEAGAWRVRVRAKNWADGAPGRFKVLIDGKPLTKEFGAGARTWAWEDGGEVTLPNRTATVALRDLTGFDGRCAGIVFERDCEATEDIGALALTESSTATPLDFDFVVVGGGLPGCCAALAAARSGLKTALVQDRPVLGGNHSGEIRVAAEGIVRNALVRELIAGYANGDSRFEMADQERLRILQAEPRLSIFLETPAVGVRMRGTNEIASVRALDLRGKRLLEFRAPLFADCTGDGWLGFKAGAEWKMGREAKAEYNESKAPDAADRQVLGASLMWESSEANWDTPFSAPWAEPFAEGRAELRGAWNWEYGLDRDMIADAEEIRDRLLLSIYGSFSLAKRQVKNLRRDLTTVPSVLGKRESRRLLGDWVLKESDVIAATPFEDAIAVGSWSIDLHWHEPGAPAFIARSQQRPVKPYWIPYRTLFSRNIANLFMAGRCFSATHVGLGSPRVINTLSQCGSAVGYAAALCREHACTPRAIYSHGLVKEVQARLGGAWPAPGKTVDPGALK